MFTPVALLLSYSFVSACTALIMTTGVTCNGFGMLFLNGRVNRVCLSGHVYLVLMQAPCHYCFVFFLHCFLCASVQCYFVSCHVLTYLYFCTNLFF